LTPDDFNFIVAVMNDASLEIVEKMEAKQEEMYDHIETELRGVQQALQSSRVVSTVPLPEGTTEVGDEPVQLHQIIDTVEARLRSAEEKAEQAAQALTQVQGVLVEQCSTVEMEKLALQEKWDEEKAQLQQGKEHFLVEQLEIKAEVNRGLRSMTIIEVQTEEQVPQ
jgi:hypothetical protein